MKLNLYLFLLLADITAVSSSIAASEEDEIVLDLDMTTGSDVERMMKQRRKRKKKSATTLSPTQSPDDEVRFSRSYLTLFG